MAPFALPALPSLPSVKSLINVSPPLIYPSPDEKNRPARSRTASASSNVSHQLDAASEYGSPRRVGRVRLPLSHESDDHTPTRRPRPMHHHSASLLASPKHDEQDERRWEPIPRLLNDSDLTPHASPCRPRPVSHRRSHSAMPQRHSLLHLNQSYTSSAPMGRLHEISRNPLASTSAISLPTLLEGGDAMTEQLSDENHVSSLGLFLTSPEEHGSTSSSSRSICSPRFSLSSLASSRTSSPIIQARARKGSRSTIDEQASSPISPVSLPLSMPPPMIPFKPSTSSSATRAEHKRSFSSVPPPQNMRPPPLPLMAHSSGTDSPGALAARSRRGSESHAIQQRQSFPHRHTSVSSTSSISDVAVLATWSFPNSPRDENVALDGHGQENRAPAMSQPSDRLRERLQSLSALDTAIRNGKAINGSPQQWSSSHEDHRVDVTSPRTPKPGLTRASTTVRPTPPRAFPAHLTHRHSHSSPSDIVPNLPIGPSISGSYHPSCGSGLNPTVSTMLHSNLNPLLPPPPVHPLPRHLRRPTTTRLRQPNPLCMPMAIQPQSYNNSQQHETPASSPGSMISDLHSIISEDKISLNEVDADGISFKSHSEDDMHVGSSDNGHETMVPGDQPPKLFVTVDGQGISGKGTHPPKVKGLIPQLRSMTSTPLLSQYRSRTAPSLKPNRSTLSLRAAFGQSQSTTGSTNNFNRPIEKENRWSFFGGLGILGLGTRSRKSSVSDLRTRSRNTSISAGSVISGAGQDGGRGRSRAHSMLHSMRSSVKTPTIPSPMDSSGSMVNSYGARGRTMTVNVNGVSRYEISDTDDYFSSRFSGRQMGLEHEGHAEEEEEEHEAYIDLEDVY
ncbi:hypothetical protein BD324DRAFT_624601 [Kockovaella imperatae]|uniref:Uncharacterized protein n=1 Tax=Kockovaella imperatae TaxID=4999 RepID=A0A1Y1UG81_9TREE|nr:hypothetical protein BD324DRAFT_624601 [Kockovaella imperatae]ORX37053.1 hypothetical protein BD324DRAFT_624601 [Kockovaella imperatae]